MDRFQKYQRLETWAKRRSWQNKMKEAIAEQCETARKEARGKRKTHVPYHVPDLAQSMVAALNADDEREGKRLLLVYRTGVLSLA